MQLTWKASESASAMHALLAVASERKLAVEGVGDVLAPLIDAPPTAGRGNLVLLLGVLLQQAATGVEQNHTLAESALTKLWGRNNANEAEISGLAAWVSSAERSYFNWHRTLRETQLVDEVVTRTTPMYDQWQARGPGMLRELARLTEGGLLADRADVVMVLPVLGGDGMAHLPANLVTLEAVLTNADDALPEVVRLAWLLGQLQFDLPAIADHLTARQVPLIARVAMLAPALAAADGVELAPLSEANLAHAAMQWRIASTAEEARQIAKTVWQWWATYQSGRVRWPVAVASLEKMLES